MHCSSYEDNEMILLIPNHETVQGVKYTLEKRAGINVQKHEKNGSLVIVDSLNAYSSYHPFSIINNNKTMYSIIPIVEFLLKEVECTGKKGISIISDIGSFYEFEKVDELIRYETSFPQKTNLKCKAFCSYRKDYFDSNSKYQQKRLFEHHFRSLVVEPNSRKYN